VHSVTPIGSEQRITPQGIATIVVLFTTAGEYHLLAGSTDLMLGYLSNQLIVTIAAGSGSGSGSGGSNGGSAASSNATTNETALTLDSASGAASSPMGAFWWVLGIGAIILVAILATVFFLRHREGDEEDEGDYYDEY
jgi:hypothetical protein